MNAKAFLNQVKKLDCMIENKQEERKRWLMLATSTTAGDASETGVRVQSSGNKQKMAAMVDNSVDIGAEIEQSISKLFIARQQIIEVIEQLSADEYDMLYKMYVGKVVADKKTGQARIVRMTRSEVSESKGKSCSWGKDLHRTALNNVQRIIDKHPEKWNCPEV